MSDGLLRLAHAGLSPASAERLMRRSEDPDDVVRAVVAGATSVNPHARAAIGVPAGQRRSELTELGIAFVTRSDDEFPSRLRRFEDSPRWLFVRGMVPEGPSIAVVGTRRCTAYGLELASIYGRIAAECGWIVVSGLAKGVDGGAHRGAIDAGGRSIAVLGSGIDVIYPRRHIDLHDELLASGGGVFSEYPPGTRPDGWRFPTRNRIIAGLADVVLVVEAGVTGGALITARIALDYGVPVFATPGDVDRASSAGTNLLIRDGAFPVFDGDDLREVLDLIVPLSVTGRHMGPEHH